MVERFGFVHTFNEDDVRVIEQVESAADWEPIGFFGPKWIRIETEGETKLVCTSEIQVPYHITDKRVVVLI